MKLSPIAIQVGVGIAVAGIVAFMAKKFFNAASAATDKVIAPIVQPIAEAVAGPKVQVADGFVLPGGRRVTFTQLLESGGKVASDQTLTWQGVKYRLTARLPDGWYSAERA